MASLTRLNYANVAAYVANVVVTYGLGSMGWFGTSTNSEISEKYQTLVTPAGYAFAIWGVIFISQFVWVVLQLLNTFSATPLVKSGVGYRYVWVCLAQVVWTIVFGFESIVLSAVAMLAILFFLFQIVSKQHRVDSEVGTKDFFLLKFPFQIHCGWIFAAFLVNINVILVDVGVNSFVQYIAAFLSLLGLLAVAIWMAYAYSSVVIPLVLAWASLGIYVELGNPKQLISETFDATRISHVQYAALVSCGILAVVVIAAGIQTVRARRSTSSGGGQSDEAAYLRADD